MEDSGCIEAKNITEQETERVKGAGDAENEGKNEKPSLSPYVDAVMSADLKEKAEAKASKGLSLMPGTVEGNENFKRPMIGPIRKQNVLPKQKAKETAPSNNTSSPKVKPTNSETNTSTDFVSKVSKVTKDESDAQPLGHETRDPTENEKPGSEVGRDDQVGDIAIGNENVDKIAEMTDDQGTIVPQRITELSMLSPAEQAKHTQIALPYLEPKWGGRAQKYYYFEVLKNGKIIDNIKLDEKSFYVFGRLPQCDVTMEHPSLSRHHAVVQHCATPNDRHEEGWYVYDLESTHGTFINKNLVKSRTYYRLKVGHVIKFAGSSRLHILQGPADDEEEESDLTVTEMKLMKEQKRKEADFLGGDDDDETDPKKEEGGDSWCAWGISDDAKEQESEVPCPDAIPQHEELYLDDPKKALKGYFEREGYDLPEYQFEEAGHGKHKCIVEVPVDSPSGQPVYAEATVSGKRKDAVVACALEACRILDRYGLLRKKDHEAKKVKTRDWEANDYYSSDEDEFLDRTGEIQKKRERRMKRAGKVTETAETYESLCAKLKNVTEEMASVNKQLEAARKVTSSIDGDGLDALDAYMSSIKEGAVDTKTKMGLKRRLFDLRKERGRLERLVNIAKPALMPASSTKVLTSMSSMFGKIGGYKRTMGAKASIKSTSGVAATVTSTEQNIVKTQENQKMKEEEVVKSKQVASTEAPLEEPLARVSPPEEQDPQISLTIHDPKTQINKKTVTSSSHEEAVSESHSETSERPVKSDGSKIHKAPKRPPGATEQTIKRLKVARVKREAPAQDYSDYDPDYAVWVPPKDQTGDGKTRLNAKFGY